MDAEIPACPSFCPFVSIVSLMEPRDDSARFNPLMYSVDAPAAFAIAIMAFTSSSVFRRILLTFIFSNASIARYALVSSEASPSDMTAEISFQVASVRLSAAMAVLFFFSAKYASSAASLAVTISLAFVMPICSNMAIVASFVSAVRSFNTSEP